MNKKLVVRLLAYAFVALFVFYIFFERYHKPRVLIIHSYSPNMQWVKEVNKGIATVIDKNYYINKRSVYLYTKQNQSRAHMQAMQKKARAIIERWDPHVIIAVDDNAQYIAAKHFVNHPEINIVYAGVIGDLKLYNYHNAKNVTGVMDELPLAVIRKALLALLPKHKRKLFFLADNSFTSKYMSKDVDNFNWAPFKIVGHVRAKTIEQWQQAVVKANQTADLLLVGNYLGLAEIKHHGHYLISNTLSQLAIPSLGFDSAYVKDGGPLAISVSAEEQGELAGKLALVALREGYVAPQTISNEALFDVSFNVKVFEKYYPGVRLPINLQALAHSRNKFIER